MKSPKQSRLIGHRNPASLPSFDSAMAPPIGEPPALATSSRRPSAPIGLLMRSIRLSPPTTNMDAPPEMPFVTMPPGAIPAAKVGGKYLLKYCAAQRPPLTVTHHQGGATSRGGEEHIDMTTARKLRWGIIGPGGIAQA